MFFFNFIQFHIYFTTYFLHFLYFSTVSLVCQPPLSRHTCLSSEITQVFPFPTKPCLVEPVSFLHWCWILVPSSPCVPLLTTHGPSERTVCCQTSLVLLEKTTPWLQNFRIALNPQICEVWMFTVVNKMCCMWHLFLWTCRSKPVYAGVTFK